MTDLAGDRSHSSESLALLRGRTEGFATAAVALGVLSYIQLLGAEKAILGILFAVIALRGARTSSSRRASFSAIALGCGYLAITAIALLLYRDKLAELIGLLQALG